ncbi:MAG: hypothetical protein KRP56_01000 [Candidatus Methanogranum gryphiswaldense]|nr:MAG: hypothetical protein KRP56_01000 [Candidatus Methanogranum sp. U3.2.1]
MGISFSDGKVLGTLGLLAALIYVIALFAAALTTSGFEIGVNNITDLGETSVYTAGCIVAGLLGLIFGAGILMRNIKGVFIAKVYGILILVAAVVLIVLGATKSDSTVVMIFEIVAIIAVISEVGFNWISEQKALMVVSAFFAIFMIGTAALDAILGFGFAVFTALWIILTAVSYISEGQCEACTKKTSKPINKKDNKSVGKQKQQASVKTTEKVPSKKVEETKKSATVTLKTDASKAEVKAEGPKVEPKKNDVQKETLKVEEKKEELPKLKVMSSREAAVVRDTKKVDDVKVEVPVEKTTKQPAESVKDMPVSNVSENNVEPIEKVKVESVSIVQEEIRITDPDDEVEELEGDLEEVNITEDTPDALVRRAAWNKGLRCRRNYGEHKIPVAFVKGKVAVYISSEIGDKAEDEALIAEGWVVLHYVECDITDGKSQGEEIAKALKENLKAERASKKKKKFRK